MGWGDYIMASGNVRRIKKSNPKLQVFINNPFNKTFYYENVFKSNPYITQQSDIDKNHPSIGINRVEAGKINKNLNRIIWNNERVSEVGDLYPTKEELAFSEKFMNESYNHWVSKNKKKPKGIIYTSNTAKKITFSKNENSRDMVNYRHAINKEWGESKWLQFINNIKNDYLIVRSASDNNSNLEFVYTAICNFRTVKAIMEKSDLYIGNEGGLSHLWATTRKNGIVFFGHWIPPYLTGYPFHFNVSISDRIHCGSLDVCEECLSFYRNLSPEYIKYNTDNYFS